MIVFTGELLAPDVQELLAQHLVSMAEHSPPESIHALDIDALQADEITFWTVRDGPAHALYLKNGFEFCGPFADYRPDPFSRFMCLRIRPAH